MNSLQLLGEMTKEAYRGRAMARGGLDIIETIAGMFKKNPGTMEFKTLRDLVKKIPATNATKSMTDPWRTAGQYAGVGAVSGTLGAGMGAGVDAIRGKGMFLEDTAPNNKLGRNGVHPDLQKLFDDRGAKMAAQLDPMEVRRRRKKLKMIAMAILGSAPGAVMGAASALPSQLGEEADKKSVLLRTLLGAGLGAGAGAGAAWVGNQVSDYADLDPLLPSMVAETRYRG